MGSDRTTFRENLASEFHHQAEMDRWKVLDEMVQQGCRVTRSALGRWQTHKHDIVVLYDAERVCVSVAVMPE